MQPLFKICRIFTAIGLILFCFSCGGSSSNNNNSNDDDIPAITGFTLPTLNGKYFNYSDNGQKYTIPEVTSNLAVGVAVFQNDSTSSGEGNLKIEFLSESLAKADQPQNQKMELLKETDSRYLPSPRDNYNGPRKYSQKKTKSAKIKTAKNRALDPIGTRDSFYHDESLPHAHKAFEKIYSGNKCLIYSEVNTTTNLPFVSATRGKEIGDTFEISNPYHSSQKPIFDVVTEFFGNPWGISATGELINGGGRDGEAPVIFLFYKGGNSYGYFFWVDQEEEGFVNPDGGYISNGAEIVYINQANANDDIAIYGTMAHEFQHLCDYNQKFVRDGNFSGMIYDESFDNAIPTLFNEGQSVLSEELNGFALSMEGNKGNDFIFNTVDSYLSTISFSTLSFYTWSGSGDYGKGYLFWRFLYDSYGKEVVINATHSSKLQPLNIEEATGKKIDVLLQEFLIAVLGTDQTLNANTTYKISTINRKKQYFDTSGLSLGFFSPLSYVTGFKSNEIKSEKPYVLRLYKVLPNLDNKVSFKIKNIKQESSYSIFTAVVDR